MSAQPATPTTSTDRPAREPRFASPEAARTFDGPPSLYNTQLLQTVAAAHGCTCQPYHDWFTYDRWHAQGLQVKEGEHATRVNVYLPITDPATGEITGRRVWVSYLFCRCQVCTPDPDHPRRRPQPTEPS